jgi:hypothetical protein
MKKRIASLLICSLGVVAMASPLAAQAATKHHHRHAPRSADASGTSSTTGTTGQSGPPGAGNGETALTGATLTSASNAALAAVPGTVDRATTETDATGAYEVIVTKSDGSRVKVIEDSSFNVLSTAATNCG